MLVVDGTGLPLGLLVDSATPNEQTLLKATLATIRVPRARGRARQRPKVLAADKLFDNQALRRWLRQHGIQPQIPLIARPHRKTPKRGRPLQLGPVYHQRWKVERTFAWLKHCRRLQVRYERLLSTYHGFCLLACISLCLNRILK